MAIPSRVCVRCKRVLPLGYFPPLRRKNNRLRLHRRCKKCLAAARRKSCHLEAWDQYLQRRYGISAVQYDLMLANQRGLCDICGLASHKRLRVDHSHTTGEVRSLLCDACNKGLGLFRDDPERLHAAIDYLQKHS